MPCVTPPPGLEVVKSCGNSEDISIRVPVGVPEVESSLTNDVQISSEINDGTLTYIPDFMLPQSVGGMKMASMPCGSWKQCFPPGFGQVEQWCTWDESEPAMVHLGEGTAAHVMNQESAETFLESDHAFLTSEHARLAMENALLVMENMQFAWGVEGSQTASWSQLGYPMSFDNSIAYMPQLTAHPWNTMAMMSGPPASGSWQWCRGQFDSDRASRFKIRATRARTDSDIPAHSRPNLEPPVRSRTLSADNINDDPGCESSDPGLRTTVMLRNLPNNYTRMTLLKLLNAEGFIGQYDFVYLPMDFKTHASLGYAFVNLVSPEQAASFWSTFEGFSKWVASSQKVCSVSWSCPYQGLNAHIERYRNSPVMHEDVPDDYKPMMFQNGARSAFPAPTKKLKAPRMRLCREDSAHQTLCATEEP